MFIFSCSDILNNPEYYDEKNKLIIVSDKNNFSQVNQLDFLRNKIQYSEIGVFIDVNNRIFEELLHYCLINRLIIYLKITSDTNLSVIQTLRDVDLVAIIDYSEIYHFPSAMIDAIVKMNINICLIGRDISFQDTIEVYEKFLEKGFSRIFNLIACDKENKSIIQGGLITREEIEKFNIKSNMCIKSRVEYLKQNIMKRHNRDITKYDEEKIDVLFVNLIVVSAPIIFKKNLGIEYLTSVLNCAGYRAECLYSTHLLVLSEIEQLILKKQIKIIGFSCMQDNIHVVKHLIKFLKNKYPDIVFFVGGAQSIDLGREFLKESKSDYIMVGESEKYIIDFVDAIIKKEKQIENIKNLRFIDSKGNFRETPRGDLIDNLDNIPFPNYIYKNDDSLNIVGVITGRGCPFNCSFCYEGAKEKTVRYRSVSNVIEEISLILKNNKNVKHIQFYDDTFTVNSLRTRELCRELKKIHENYGITWSCEIHCQTIYNDSELIQIMVDAGLVEAQIGLESGNDEILKRYNKKITLDMILKTIENCNKAGLRSLQGNILLAGAGETKEQINEYFELVEKLLLVGKGMLQLSVVMFWPFPSTPISVNPDLYGVKIIQEQCEYSINSIKNFVSESEFVSREEYITYYYSLNNRIEDIYLRLASEMDAKEASKYWKPRGFDKLSPWGKALSKFEHMSVFFFAKSNANVGNLNDDNVYPIRTFNMLSYVENKIYLKNINLILENFDSRILELCNGKNTINEIGERLGVPSETIHDRLSFMETKMLVYGSVI